MVARLEVITGPMSSWKTEELKRRIKRAAYANERILVVRPSRDDRHTRNVFDLIRADEKLGNYQQLAMMVLDHSKELRSSVDAFRPGVLAIDEAQLFDLESGQEIVEYLAELLEKKKGKNFVISVAGLDMDAWRRPFGIMPQLLAMADEVLKLTAICLNCRGEYGPAIFTQKKGGTSEQIETGDVGELYGARCRFCYEEPQKPPA